MKKAQEGQLSYQNNGKKSTAKDEGGFPPGVSVGLRVFLKEGRHRQPISIPRRSILCLIGLILLIGCVPESDNPLSGPRSVQWDQSVTGTWAGRVRESNATVWLHIAPDRDPPADSSMILTEEGKGMELFFYRMHPSEVGPYRFMNLKPAYPENPRVSKGGERLRDAKGGNLPGGKI